MKILFGGFILSYLVIASVVDFKEKVVDLRLLAVYVLATPIAMFFTGEELFPAARILGICPGLLLLLLSFMKGEVVGKGDGMVVVWLGYALGLTAILEVLLLGWCFAFFVAVRRLVKGSRKRIAFVPFLSTAFLVLFLNLVTKMVN